MHLSLPGLLACTLTGEHVCISAMLACCKVFDVMHAAGEALLLMMIQELEGKSGK